MKKTSIYREPELDAAIKQRADVLGISKAEAIRRAVAREVGVRKQPRITAIGAGDGPGDLSARHDEYLADLGADD